MIRLLIVDDSDEDFDVFIDCVHRLKNPWSVDRCKRGEDVLPFLDQKFSAKQYIDLIVLDLNLIGLGGLDVLKLLKSSEKFQMIPVLTFSTSSSARDIQACYRLGVSSYTCKPVDLAKFEAFVHAVDEFWCRHVVFGAPAAP